MSLCPSYICTTRFFAIMIQMRGVSMCIPHQKPAKVQKKDIRGQRGEKREIYIDRDTFEHGDKNFVDQRKVKIQSTQKRKGFFSKLFS